jgi:hypothetical protein
MGAAAAEALGQYRSLVPKERKKLIRSVANALAKLEKKKPKGVQDKARIERVTKTLIESVRSLSGDRKLSSSREVRLWLRKSGKPPSPGNTSAPK